MFDFSCSCVRQSPHVCFLGRRRRAHGIPEKNVPISLSPSLCFFLGGGGGGGESIELLPEKRFLLPLPFRSSPAARSLAFLFHSPRTEGLFRWNDFVFASCCTS